MMFGQEYKKNASQVNKNFNKKNHLWIILIVLILAAISFYLIYLNITRKKILEDLKNQPPIVLALNSDIEKGGYGTFKYYPGTGKMEKISDMAFKRLSYSEDRTKIIGVVNDGFYGIAELDLRDNTVKEIVSIKDVINKLIVEMGIETPDTINYRDMSYEFSEVKYYKDGYTFMYDRNIYFLYQDKGVWNMKPLLNKDEYMPYNYFFNKDNNDEVYLEDGYLLKKVSMQNNSSKTFVKIYSKGTTFDGFSDMSDDRKKWLYYKKGYISIYDLQTGKDEDIIKHFSMYQDILNFKLSKDNRYIFYTLGEVSFMNTTDYRYNFYIVDTKTGSRIHLKRFDYSDYFYGFDW